MSLAAPSEMDRLRGALEATAGALVARTGGGNWGSLLNWRLQAPPPGGPGLRSGVDFWSRPDSERYALGRVTVVNASSPTVDVDAAEVARHTAALARFFGYTGQATVLLALVSKPKVLRHDAPLQMADINGGVTYQDDGLVVLWRFDGDFWKVLTHELVHLMTGDRDEARTEAAALRLWCCIRAIRHGDSFEERLARQMELTEALAARVAATDSSLTNEGLYSAGALCYLRGGGDECGARERYVGKPSGSGVEVFTATDGSN
jgi:hypothetical protein